MINILLSVDSSIKHSFHSELFKVFFSLTPRMEFETSTCPDDTFKCNDASITTTYRPIPAANTYPSPFGFHSILTTESPPFSLEKIISCSLRLSSSRSCFLSSFFFSSSSLSLCEDSLESSFDSFNSFCFDEFIFSVINLSRSQLTHTLPNGISKRVTRDNASAARMYWPRGCTDIDRMYVFDGTRNTDESAVGNGRSVDGFGSFGNKLSGSIRILFLTVRVAKYKSRHRSKRSLIPFSYNGT
mmetsp:Transcript_8209/g.14857  ORF Transcript_8209/g.14857 Transcript_8209/m.14857 type:complete len:243 (-) Transcript_8209:41-769(-)